MAQPGKAKSLGADPGQVDPKHYKVEFENEHVRVVRVQYGPLESSPMHGHPAGVGVCLTNHIVKFTFPDGKSEMRMMKAGASFWMAAEEHEAENMSEQPLELVLVELKR